MGFLKDILSNIIARQIYPSKKERQLEQQNIELMEGINRLLEDQGKEPIRFTKPETPIVEKAATIFVKLIIILVGLLIILIMIALKVM